MYKESCSVTEGSTETPGLFLLPVESVIPIVYLSRKSDLVIFRLDLTAWRIVQWNKWLTIAECPVRDIP